MTDLEKAARLALDALLEMTEPQRTASESARYKLVQAAIDALDAALAQQQAEPVVLDAKIVHFAKTALHEMPRPATDWHHCAKRVCEAVVALSQQQAEWVPERNPAKQAEQNTFFNRAKGGYSNGKPAPTDQRVSGVVAGGDRCDERDQGERGRTGRNGGEVAVTGRTRPAMDQHRSDGSSAGADGAHEGSGKTYNVLKQQAEPVQAEPVVEPVAAMPAIGDYVLATKYSDGDPGDPWALGFYAGELDMGITRHDIKVEPRYLVNDSSGATIRGNGYRRVARVRKDVGAWLLNVAAKQLEQSPPGTVNIWTMLTDAAFDLSSEQQAEPVAVQAEPVKGESK